MEGDKELSGVQLLDMRRGNRQEGGIREEIGTRKIVTEH